MSTELLHPMLVHFPIALLAVALLFDVAALFFPKAELVRASLYVSALGALGAVGAYFTGEAAEESAERLPGIEALLERHEDLGKLLMGGAIAVLVIRLAFFWRRWHEPIAGRAVLAFLGAVLVGLVAATGYAGGQLVYEHGAGVAPITQRLGEMRHRADD